MDNQKENHSNRERANANKRACDERHRDQRRQACREYSPVRRQRRNQARQDKLQAVRTEASKISKQLETLTPLAKKTKGEIPQPVKCPTSGEFMTAYARKQRKDKLYTLYLRHKQAQDAI
jgi:hypothetical protein